MNPSATRIEHLVTQMKWRLQEGGGEAIYEIGVEDNGTLTGLTKEELDCSLRTIGTLAGRYEFPFFGSAILPAVIFYSLFDCH